MRDSKQGPTAAAQGDDAQMQVLERMAETLQGKTLEAATMVSRVGPNGLAKKVPPRRGVGAPGVQARVPHTASPVRTGPSAAVAHVTLLRILGSVEGRIVNVLSQADSAAERQEAAIELGLLVSLRRALQAQAALGPDDAVLCDALMEFAETVQGVLIDLEAGGTRRLRRLWDYNRELLSELVALGGAADAMKDAVSRARARITPDAPLTQLQPVTDEALSMYNKIQQELDRRCPRGRGSLLDDMTRA